MGVFSKNEKGKTPTKGYLQQYLKLKEPGHINGSRDQFSEKDQIGKISAKK